MLYCSIPEMSNPTERYRKICLGESLPRVYRYPVACKELSFILRGAYSKLPKNLQSLIFQDILSAFRLLPEMQTGGAVAAAHLLLQSAEATLPKQKKSLVVTEFKHAKVAHTRRRKAHREEKGSAQLPQDVLVYIFSLLDLQSLISVAQVCWSWNLVANDNHLWKLQYTIVFGRSGNYSRTKMQWGGRLLKEDCTFLEENVVSQTHIDWKETFKRAYIGTFSKKLMSNRGYCGHCNTVVWLNNWKCSDRQCELKYESLLIKPISPQQVVEYITDGCISMISSSDSDSESDEEPISRLWAYPRNICRWEKKPIV
ncbi:F-box protein At5g52880-like isoform X2 [Durio zibethinus]|uniref:F-box protein At5g52880-like isoform X2 n=1 Tax=Durio zibethinus TaxID=66656 RepID=A0A6P6BAB1_DURZI|nr:F-box protein At5g52880-like isoform X2 [Durio zibethinus]